MIYKLIDRIEVEPIKKDQGKTTREIKITWRFIKQGKEQQKVFVLW